MPAFAETRTGSTPAARKRAAAANSAASTARARPTGTRCAEISPRTAPSTWRRRSRSSVRARGAVPEAGDTWSRSPRRG